MIYPQKINAKKSDIILKILIIGSVILGGLLVIINKITTPNIKWAGYCNVGIIYIWITVLYSVYKNINIAGHVLLHTIAISVLTVYIDYRTGFMKWSINIAIPITIIIANVTMLILTIVSYKKYIRYVIYQLIIILFSMLPIVFLTENIVKNPALSIIASGISILNFLFCLIFCANEVKQEIIRKFHI